jgi:hypothetical protein
MRFNLQRMTKILSAALLIGAGSTFACSAARQSVDDDLTERASTLLAEIRGEAAGLRRSAEMLDTFARNHRLSWQSHAYYLDRVKDHINAVGKRLAELQQIQYAVPSWQQEATDEVTPHAAAVAEATEAAILHLNENRSRLFVSEYKDHLTMIADRSADMKETVNKFLQYGKLRQKLQQSEDQLKSVSD